MNVDPDTVRILWATKRIVRTREDFKGLTGPRGIWLFCDRCRPPEDGKVPKVRAGFGLAEDGTLVLLDRPEREARVRVDRWTQAAESQRRRRPDKLHIPGGTVIRGTVAVFLCAKHADAAPHVELSAAALVTMAVEQAVSDATRARAMTFGEAAAEAARLRRSGESRN